MKVCYDRRPVQAIDLPSPLLVLTTHSNVYPFSFLEWGTSVVKVPKAIVLSVETTAIANLLSDEEIEGYAGLILGCMYEVSRGAGSPWSTYLSFLAKRPAQMATSLAKDTREMLKYCEAYNDIESDIVSISQASAVPMPETFFC